MPVVDIRQAPGWWSTLVQAVCAECGWHGPVRDCLEWRGRFLVKCDQTEHKCYSDE